MRELHIRFLYFFYYSLAYWNAGVDHDLHGDAVHIAVLLPHISTMQEILEEQTSDKTSIVQNDLLDMKPPRFRIEQS